MLDCCFSGAFAQGAKAALALGERFHGHGRGRVVLTASRASEYSFEGDPVPGSAMPGSVFTRALVAGIRTGAADGDHDGFISVDDAYTYAFDQIRAADAQQTPQRWLYGAEGTILLARSPAGVTIAPAELPVALRTGLDSSLPTIRLGAVAALAEWLTDDDPARAQAARNALGQVVDTDVPSVAAAAQALLDSAPPPGKVELDDVASVTDTRRARRGWPRRPRGRRLVYAAVAAVVLAAAGTTAALLISGRGDSPAGGGDSPAGGGHATSGIFTETTPWRLQIWDDSSAHGCTVVVTQTATGLKQRYVQVHDRKSFQMHITGQLRWESNDSGCAVAPQSGPGKVTLPYSKLESGSDSMAFASPSSGKIAVSVVDYQGNDSCEVELRDAHDGQTLDSDKVASGVGSVVLESNGQPLVYLAANYCIVRIAAG